MINKYLALGWTLLTVFCYSAHENILVDFNELGTWENNQDEKFRYLFNGNWKATLNSSSDFVLNRQLTYTKNVPVASTKNDQLFINKGTSGNVLGVRVKFPTWPNNGYALVKPALEIESYGGDDGNKFLYKGLIKNVGIIKRIKAYVKGKNYPNSLYVNLNDGNELVTSYLLGYLNYEGWKELIYHNQNYLEDIRFRDMVGVPLYPRVEPMIKLDSLTLFRNGEFIGGDFITYIAWIKVEYDKAIITEEEEIDDEKVWGIQTTKTEEKAGRERKRLKNIKELEDLEKKKMNIYEESSAPDPTNPPGQ